METKRKTAKKIVFSAENQQKNVKICN